MNMATLIVLSMILHAVNVCAALKPFTTLFCPGILSSELQTTKYCPVYTIKNSIENNDYVANIITSHGNTIFDGTNVYACNFPEMVRINCTTTREFHLLNTIISSCTQHITKRVNALFGPYQLAINPTYGFSAQQINDTYFNFFLDWSKLNFGQEDDIACLKEKHHTAHSNANTDLIGFGFSRGAATLFNYIALEYISDMPLKALVFEACPMNIAAFTSLLNLAFLEKTTCFKKDGICPEVLAQQFALMCKKHALPVLFICSKKDEVVPYEQTLKMCMRLHQQGVKNIYLIVLNDSPHNAYLFNNTFDRARYHRGIHRFYKECGLAYQQDWASEESGELIHIS